MGLHEHTPVQVFPHKPNTRTDAILSRDQYSPQHGIRHYTEHRTWENTDTVTVLKAETITNKASQLQFQTVQKVTDSNTVTNTMYWSQKRNSA